MRRNKLFVLVLLLSITVAYAGDDEGKKPKRWWSTPLIIVVYIGFFVFAAGLSFCIRHFRDRRSLVEYRNNQQRAADGGLGEEEIESLPSLRYSEIKMKQIEKGNEQLLECSVCLAEFKDEEVVRILPDCYHVFHPHCIAPWLASHVTCPICRSSLEHRQGSSLSMSSTFDCTSGSLSQRFDHSGEQHNDDNNDGDGGNNHVTIEIEGSSSSTLHPKAHVPDITSSSTREFTRSYSTGDLTIDMTNKCGTTSRGNFIISSIMPRESSPKYEYREALSKGKHWDNCISPKSDSYVNYSSLMLVNMKMKSAGVSHETQSLES